MVGKAGRWIKTGLFPSRGGPFRVFINGLEGSSGEGAGGWARRYS